MIDCCGDDDIVRCNCVCHTTGAVHIMVCCTSCPYCHRDRISFICADEHIIKCKERYDLLLRPFETALKVQDIVGGFGFSAEITRGGGIAAGSVVSVGIDLKGTFPGNKMLIKLRQEIMNAVGMTKDAITFKNLFPGATFKEPADNQVKAE